MKVTGMRFILCLLVMALTLSACASPIATPGPSGPTSTPRPFPTFGPTRTRTPTRTPPATETATVEPAIAPADVLVATPSTQTVSEQPRATKRPANPSNKMTRAELPSMLESALVKAGVNDPKVYWFTFDEGDREQALMIQYASPLRWQPGYVEMLHAAQATLGQYFLQVDPPLYSAFIAATDITGTSDAVVRLRRAAVEKLARGEIGEEDFVNNYFEPVQVTLKCTSEACTAKMATPFVFHFKFPFPTPTPKP